MNNYVALLEIDTGFPQILVAILQNPPAYIQKVIEADGYQLPDGSVVIKNNDSYKT